MSHTNLHIINKYMNFFILDLSYGMASMIINMQLKFYILT